MQNNQAPPVDREQVEFYLSCRSLKNLDILSKSDPQVRLYFKNKSNAWIYYGETEIIKDNLNPNFHKTFLVDFIFETHQHIKFEIIDIDGPTHFEMIGNVETTVGTIMGARKQTFIADIKHKEKVTGKLIVRAEKVDLHCQSVSWQWSGVKLMNTDGWFGKSDPLLRFFKKKETGENLLVHQTEVIMDNLNPVWKPFKVLDKKLCSEYNQDFKVECWDWEKSGKYQFIGEFETSLERIKSGVREFELHNPKKKSKTGTLVISNFSIGPNITFVDYLRGGTQLNIMVAIDFTGSNGNPSRSDSLHYKSMDPPNQYYQAISSVCPIVLKYDFDQLVPLYGFGAQVLWSDSREVSHCFPLSQKGNEEVKGTEGILDTYYQALDGLNLSGPTNFAPIIRHVSNKCREIQREESDQYMILLILTDGEITDMADTIHEIVNADTLPLSIIIVGVGNADFEKMERLDGDHGALKSRGQVSKRDLVQFVPFKDFKHDPEMLAKHVLAEVPDQVVQYMELVNRKPMVAQLFDMNNLSVILPSELKEESD